MTNPATWQVHALGAVTSAGCKGQVNALTDVAFYGNDGYVVGTTCPSSGSSMSQATTYWMDITP
jgi:hypothetical protein